MGKNKNNQKKKKIYLIWCLMTQESKTSTWTLLVPKFCCTYIVVMGLNSAAVTHGKEKQLSCDIGNINNLFRHCLIYDFYNSFSQFHNFLNFPIFSISFSEWCLFLLQWINNSPVCKYLFHCKFLFEQITYFNPVLCIFFKVQTSFFIA